MNKRQKRKQFKKKYKMTPEQAEKLIENALQKIDWIEIGKTIVDIIQEMYKVLNIEKMSDEEYKQIMENNNISNGTKGWLTLLRQQTLKKSIEAEEVSLEKISK